MHRSAGESSVYRFLSVLVILSGFFLIQPFQCAYAEEDDTDDPSLGTASVDFVPDADMSLSSGAANVKIPIQVTPGRANITPKLALLYNNYHSTGWLGVGWDLDLGSISRSTKFGLSYSNKGSLAFTTTMNGVSSELVLRSDWSCPSGYTAYGARIENSMAKYCYSPASGWLVTAKDGTRYYYGRDTNSRQDFDNGVNIFKWHLDKVIDTNGNYMLITYNTAYKSTTGAIYPQQIQYTGNEKTSLPPRHYVNFNLTPETAPIVPQFRTKHLVQTTYLLKTIEVFGNGENGANGTFLRKYELTYGASEVTARSNLVSVKQMGKDGGVLSTPTFTWKWQQDGIGGIGSFSSAVQDAQGWSYGNTKWLNADLNGDKKSDIVGVRNVSGIITLHAGISHGNGSYTEQDISTGIAWPGNAKWFPADINGDGKNDIVGAIKNGTNIRILTFLSTSTGTPSFQALQPVDPSPAIAWDTHAAWMPANCNGDGKTCIVGVINYGGHPQFITFVPNGNSYSRVDSPAITDLSWEDAAKWFVGDVNGDGKTDIIGVRYANYRVQLVTAASSGNGVYALNYQSTSTNWPATPIFYATDINGDGLTDVVGQFNNGGKMRLVVFFSNGNASFNDPTVQNTNIDYGDYNLIPGDINADGKMDFRLVGSNLVQTIPNSDFTGYIRSYRLKARVASSDGDGTFTFTDDQQFLDTLVITVSSGIITTLATPYTWSSGDVDGDGKTDLVLMFNGNGWNGHARTISYLFQSSSDLIAKATNGIGGTTTFAYTPSSAWTNDPKMPFVLQTVSSVAKSDGRGQTITTNHSYSGGNYDPSERDFLGFAYALTVRADNSKTETWFSQEFTTKGTQSMQVTTSSDNVTTKTVFNTYTAQPVKNASGADVVISDIPANLVEKRVTWARLDHAGTESVDSGSYVYASNTDYTYDPIWLVPVQTTTFGANVNTSTTPHTFTAIGDTILTTSTTYNESLKSSWILKPSSVTVLDSANNVASRKWFDYDSSGNLLAQESYKSDASAGCINRCSGNPAISYTYAGEGNVQVATDARGNQTAFTYDTRTKSLVTVMQNAAGHVTTKDYYYESGKVKEVAPPHLQGMRGTTYEYDEFWRPSKETRPDGGYTTYRYLNFGNPAAPQYVEKVEYIAGGGAGLSHYTNSLFDGFGRTFQTQNSGPGGKINITSLTYFDEMGRVKMKAKPFLCASDWSSCEAAQYATFAYDGLSRVTIITRPDGGETRNVYKGLTKEAWTKQTDTVWTMSASTYDVYKRLRKMEDNNHTITTYTYDALGNLLKVSRPNPNNSSFVETVMAYNSLSQKISMNDPDMGHWTYSYDKSGNLVSQTDAKNQTITFTYDAINRMTKKTYPDGHVVYNCYDKSYSDATCQSGTTLTYATGALTRTIDASSDTEDKTLSFDVMQRVARSSKRTESNTVTIAKTYDSAGRTYTMTYFPGAGSPKERTFTYSYDAAGNTLAVKEGSLTHSAYAQFTALNQPGKASFVKTNGDRIDTTYTYYPETGRLSGLTSIQQLGQKTQTVACTGTTPAVEASGTVSFAGWIKTVTASGNTITFTASSGGVKSLTLTNATVVNTTFTLPLPGIQKIVGSGNSLNIYTCSTWNGFTCTAYNTTPAGTITLVGATASGSAETVQKRFGIQKIVGSGSTLSLYACSLLDPLGVACVAWTRAAGSITLSGQTSYSCPLGSYPCSGSPVTCSRTVPAYTNTIQSLAYTYDLKGNVKQIVDNQKGVTHDYTYDGLDRLATAKGNSGSTYNESYAYDNLGNIQSKTGVGNYTYNSQDSHGSIRPHAVSTAGSNTFTYDDNGNMTSKNGTNIYWNVDNKPTTIGSVSFAYDGMGNRVKKVGPSNTTYYFGEAFEQRGATDVIHLFANGQRVASIRTDSSGNVQKIQYYHPNHIGSAAVVTDETAAAGEWIEYLPYGTYQTGYPIVGSGFPKVNYTFTDQEDDDTGFYNYKARLYDPVIGRFVSADSLVPSPGDLQSFNRYSYVLNNPLRYTDPSGHYEDFIDYENDYYYVSSDYPIDVIEGVDIYSGAWGPMTPGGYDYNFSFYEENSSGYIIGNYAYSGMGDTGWFSGESITYRFANVYNPGNPYSTEAMENYEAIANPSSGNFGPVGGFTQQGKIYNDPSMFGKADFSLGNGYYPDPGPTPTWVKVMSDTSVQYDSLSIVFAFTPYGWASTTASVLGTLNTYGEYRLGNATMEDVWFSAGTTAIGIIGKQPGAILGGAIQLQRDVENVQNR